MWNGSRKHWGMLLRHNSFIREILGEHIYVKYLEAKEEEWRDFRAQVTDWEVNQYLYKY